MSSTIHPEMDRLLQGGSDLGASDLHVIAGVSAAFRVNGEIILAEEDPFTPEEVTAMSYSLLSDAQRLKFEQEWELCVSIRHPGAGRVRVTLYRRNGAAELSLRFCGESVSTREQLALPERLDDLVRRPNGLVLITGPTGSGKTTTLNYLVDMLNSERRCKILTIEDPIEYVHENRRALIHALRQDPDVMVIGEIRDHEAIATALTAAETGHLVLATMHSPGVTHALERIIGVFEGSAQRQVVLQLANTLQGIIAQELLPSVDRLRRVLAYELLLANTAIRTVIRQNELHHLYNVMQTSQRDGMVLMDNCLMDLYGRAQITYDTAVSKARQPDRFQKFAQ